MAVTEPTNYQNTLDRNNKRLHNVALENRTVQFARCLVYVVVKSHHEGDELLTPGCKVYRMRELWEKETTR